MLIRESDVPTPPDPKDELWERMGDSPEYKAIIDKYKAAIEVAKSKAVRVENFDEISKDLIEALDEQFGGRVDVPAKILYRASQPLPDGWSYRTRELPTGIISGGLIPQYSFGGRGLTHHTETVAVITPDAPQESEDDLWQTTNPNKPMYIATTNISTDGFDRNWLEMWQQIEIWYGDPKKRETGIQLLERLKSMYPIQRHKPCQQPKIQ